MEQLPGWDEITKAPDWGGLEEPQKQQVFQKYIQDIGATPEWKGLQGPEKFKVIRQMQVDAGFYKAEKPQEGIMRGAVVPAIKQVGAEIVGAGETAANLVGQGLSFLNPIPGLAGVGKSITGTPEEATQTVKSVQDAMNPYIVYEPKTAAGKKGKEAVEYLFGKIQQGAQILGGAAQDITTPILGQTAGQTAGATVGGLAELLPMIYGPKALGRIKAKIVGGEPLTFNERAAIENNLKEIGKNSEQIIKDLKTADEGIKSFEGADSTSNFVQMYLDKNYGGKEPPHYDPIYEKLKETLKMKEEQRTEVPPSEIPLKEKTIEQKNLDELTNFFNDKAKEEPSSPPSGVLGDIPTKETPKVEVPQSPLLDQLAQEGQQRERIVGEEGAITLGPIKSDIGEKIGKWANDHLKRFNKLRFWPELPAELRNDYRTELIGGRDIILDRRNKIDTAIYGGLKKQERAQAAEYIFAKDEVSRQQAGKGNPDLTLADAIAEQKRIEGEITNPDVIKAADRWNALSGEARNDLVSRGKLDATDTIGDYAPHLVEAYTPEWAPTFGWPTRLRKPFRGYTQEAKGTTKEIRKNPEVLSDYLAKIQHDNMIEDWLYKQAEKYDKTPSLDKMQKASLFGTDKAGRANPQAKTGRIVEIDGEQYRAWNPEKPFNRRLYENEEGQTVLGREKKTYLVPMKIYDFFEHFSENTSYPMYLVNKVNSWGKSAAILSSFGKYNINNLLGDTWMSLYTHPEKVKFLKNVDDAAVFLLKDPAKYTPFESTVAEFIKGNAILDSGFIKELPTMRVNRNPVKALFEKAQQASNYRENVLRTANTMYLVKEIQEGRGQDLPKKFDWIDVSGLPANAAIGKIARDFSIDYNSVSQTYRKLITGFAMPFATWYLKGSKMLGEFAVKHPGQAVAGLSALPVAAMAINNRSDEIQEIEKGLPDNIRSGVHFILGKNDDGTSRVMSFQTPQDALIGTKIFSVAYDQVNRVLNGEKSISEAAKDTAKTWGEKEVRGLSTLVNPIARFLGGLINGRDPFDNRPIYPYDYNRLTSLDAKYYQSLFFIKTMVPVLGASTYNAETKYQTAGKTAKDALKNFAGLPALGVRDYTEKAEVKLPDGRRVDYETFDKMNDLSKKEMSLINSLKGDFIKGGMAPDKFYQSETFQKKMIQLEAMHLKGNLGGKAVESIKDRITNEIEKDPTTWRMWIANKIDAAETPKERLEWRIMETQIRNFQMIKKIKALPVSVRPHLEEYLQGIPETFKPSKEE